MSERLLGDLFEYEGLELIIGHIKLMTLVIYRNSNTLTPEDSRIIENSLFQGLYLRSDISISKIRTLMENHLKQGIKETPNFNLEKIKKITENENDYFSISLGT
jgi:hypothetical protein